MNIENNSQTINLTITGKDIDVEKTQKRLRCAALATNSELYLAWQHIPAEHSIAITYFDFSGEENDLSSCL